MNVTGKSTSGFQPLTVICHPSIRLQVFCADSTPATTRRERCAAILWRERPVGSWPGQRVLLLSGSGGDAVARLRGSRKKPLESVDSRGFPLCAEGDLNPHPLSRTSTSS